MAKSNEKKKKRVGIVQRMMFGDDNKPDITPEQMNMSAWEQFKDLMFRRFGTMVLLNLLTCIFAIPGVLVILLFYMNKTVGNNLIPYSGNLGIGYPVVIDAIARGSYTTFTYNTFMYLSLVPCIALLAMGISGNMYVIRKLLWNEPTSTAKDFFRGIKKCWFHSLVIGIAFGLTLLLFMFTLEFFDVYHLDLALKVISIILASILLVFMSMFTVFFLTQNAAFKMSWKVLIKNSTLFIFGTNIVAIFFFGIAIAPAFLAFIPGITILLGLIYLFIGFSFATLVMSTYCHSCYKRYLYDKISSMPNYGKRDDEKEGGESGGAIAKGKKSPVPYKNPKKRKKSIDEGSSITPLMPTFRREDLERLEKEHEKVLSESMDGDDELGELDDEPRDIGAETEAVDKVGVSDADEKDKEI